MNEFSSFITFLRTEDLEKTTNFYVNLLDCKLVLDQGLCKIFQTAKGSYLGFCSHEFLNKDKNSVCLTFVCDSKEEVDEWYQKLRSRNVVIKEPPKENTKYKIYNLFASDPNGITIEIQYFLHPFP